MMSRTSFQLLLLVNLALAGVWIAPSLGVQIVDDGGREPERLANQLHPEQVHILRESDLHTAAPEASPSTTSVDASAPVAAANTAPANACIQFSALASEQVAAINDAIKPMGNALSLREEDTTTTSYWVNIPPSGGRAGADKRSTDLKQLGVQDFFIVKDGADQYAVSLGLYHNEAAARRMLESLQKKGIKTARITTRENVSSSRVRLSGSSEAIDRLTRDLADKLKGAEQASCSPA